MISKETESKFYKDLLDKAKSKENMDRKETIHLKILENIYNETMNKLEEAYENNDENLLYICMLYNKMNLLSDNEIEQLKDELLILGKTIDDLL